MYDVEHVIPKLYMNVICASWKRCNIEEVPPCLLCRYGLCSVLLMAGSGSARATRAVAGNACPNRSRGTLTSLLDRDLDMTPTTPPVLCCIRTGETQWMTRLR